MIINKTFLRNSIIFCIVQFSISIEVSANNINDSSKAETQYNIAHSFISAANYDSAFPAFKKALTLYRKTPNWEKQVDIYNSLAGISWKYRKLEDATLYCDSALKILRKEDADSINLQYAKVYHNIGTIELLKGNLRLSIVKYEKAININEQDPYNSKSNLAENYNNIGIAYSYMNNSIMAIRYSKKYLNLIKKYQPDNNYKLGKGYQNLGLAYVKDHNYQEAKENYIKALNLYRNVLTEPHITFGQIYLNLGVLSAAENDFPQTIVYNNKALLNYGVNTNTPHPEGYRLYHNNAGLYKMMGKYDSAIISENKYTEYLLNEFGNKHHELANSYEYLGRIYHAQGNNDTALAYIQKAVISNIYNFNDTSISAIPDLSNILSKFYLSKAIIGKATVLSDIYAATGETTKLDLALKNYHLYSDIVDLIILDNTEEDVINTVYRDYIGAYEEAILLGLKAYNETKNEKYIHDAFFFSEKTKALILKATNNDKEAINSANIPYDVIQKDNVLCEKVIQLENDYKNIIFTLPFDSLLASVYLNDSIFEAKRALQQFISTLEKVHPQYFQLKYAKYNISVKDIQELKLGGNDALIEYYLGDSTLFVFTLTKNEINLDTLKIDSTFLSYIDNFRRSTSDYEFIKSNPKEASKVFWETSVSLYNKLFPIKCRLLIHDKANLTIIPDGILNYVPYDALITKKHDNKNENYSNAKYLINDFSINYAYSASMLKTKQTFNHTESYYAGYAPIYDTTLLAEADELKAFDIFRSNPSALTGNITEVTNAGNLFNGDIYIGADAGEKDFKESTQNYSIIHLAMHALINDKNPLSSTLIFTNTNDSIEDDYLHTYEIYSLKLNADLAVLSACNTANGIIQSGEGIMSLSRAFMYAGVDNIVSTLWPANDATSNLLMEHFFKKIKQGMPIANALRSSKINYLKTADPVFANPYYWANFILIGNNETVFINQPSFIKRYWIWIFSSLILISLIVWRKKVRS